ncbi:Signal transduction histidine kinase [Monaibacterium marinum]|uniref:histidine kinase n=1 Tax=Pontivivens marinum TaxID=1690039 RepID=A0A2C9CM10_9RHOB|nr:ATP-binding protein [Monaibacterium marinum]SOH92303.1 Signal transduction histidine kinase [Monaibacterium marinum]
MVQRFDSLVSADTGTGRNSGKRVELARRILILASITISISTSVICLMLVFALGQPEAVVLPVMFGSLTYLSIPIAMHLGMRLNLARNFFFILTIAVVLAIGLTPQEGIAFGFVGYLPIFVCIGGMLFQRKGVLVITGSSLLVIALIATADLTRLPIERTIQSPGSIATISMRHGMAVLFTSVLVIVAMGLYDDMLQRLRTARDQARRASESKTSFLANVSHEVRTPLNAILGMAEILRSTELNEDQRRKVETIAESGSTLLEMLNDILDISRLEADRMPISPARQDSSDLIAGVERLWGPIAEDKNLQCLIDFDPDIPEAIEIDAQRFRQCMNNLMSNAIKFTASGFVRISARWDDRTGSPTRLVIDVQDTGIGMPPDAASRVFDPFGQADDTIMGTFGGSGMGLTITRQLAKMMGGDLTFKSVAGQGTIFTLTISAKALQAEAPRDPRDATPAIGLRVLVVDDIPTNLMVAATYIRALGAQVDEAMSGDQAVELMRNQAFDLVLLDMHMPDTDGLWVLEKVSTFRRPPPPIVMITAGATEAEMDRARELGARDVLIKPLTPRLLESLLRNYAA